MEQIRNYRAILCTKYMYHKQKALDYKEEIKKIDEGETNGT